MTSSMLAGERSMCSVGKNTICSKQWASARRGGMTVLGKVAVPKPLNLPSQKLENHGLDPNVEIVPKGSLSWGSRPSSSTSNPWGSSAISPNAESSTASPRHPSGRPSSGGGLSRPSTAGSDRMHEPSASTWGPNSRPSSASGVLTSNQSSLTSSRPLSAETRPGSSHLSRFAEPVFDNSVVWGPNGTADKLSIPTKVNDFSLSSGDFPTLGSKKDDAAKSSEAHDHGSHGRPGSASGRTVPAKERNEISQADPKSGTVDTWTREGSPRVVDGVHPSAEKWQGEPQHYVNPNVPPQHFDAWRGPPMNAPPGVWYGGPPAGPPYPPVPHGGFPMEPFPYYRPQIPPALVNSQPGPPPGPGPRGHHPRNGDFYRPQMPDAFIRPGMPRPGFYPGPGPYDGYFGPPMGYNPNDRDMPFMGMPPGPPVYNMCPSQNPSELSDGHFRPGGRGSVGNMFVSEQPEESRGPYKVLRKRENERDADMDEESWEQTAAANSLGLEKSNQPRPSFHRNERGTDARRNEDMPSRRNTLTENPSSRMLHNQGYPSDSVIVHSPEGTRRSKASNESWGKKSEVVAPSFPEVAQDIPANPKDSSLIQKIEGLNAKARASDVRGDAAPGSIKEEQKNRLLINPKDNSTIALGSTSNTGDVAPPRDINVIRGENTFRSTTASPPFSRQAHHGVRSRADHHIKGRSNNQDNDGWRKKPPILGFEVPDNHISAEAAENPETKNAGESLTPMVDPTDGQAQRARMRELAKQRAIQLQKEEEERIREQKAKSLAKLEELNRRTLAADGTTQAAEKTAINVPEQEDVDGFQKPTGSAIDTSKQEIPSSDLDAKAQAVAQADEKSTTGVGQSLTLSRDSKSTNSQQEPVVSQGQALLSKQNADNATDAESKTASLGNDGSLPRQKRANHRQKQSVQMVESSDDKPTLSGTGETLTGSAGAAIKNPGNNVAVSGEDVPSQESSLPNNSNILSESTQQRKRNNKSSKTKHKLDDASLPATVSSSSVPREGDLGKLSTESRKLESSHLDLDPSTVLVTDSKDAMQSNLEQISSLPSEEAHGRTTNQYKPQHSRRMPRNPQANNRSADRFHGSDGVMWAPVRAQNKEERGDEYSQRTMQDDVPLPSKSMNSVQTNLRSKRAEMERYIPKPVAKELAQQGSIQQSSSPSSPRINTSEDVTDREELGSQPAIPVSANVGSVVESKSGDIKQNKQQVKSHGAWRQRGPTEVHREQGVQQGASLTSNTKKTHNKPPSQHEASNPVPTETNIMHEWDPSDGWFMPEYPPTEVVPVVKDEGAATGKGKRPAYKGQRGTAKNQDVDHKDVSGAEVEKNLEINQTDRPTSSKENRWQPKPQAYRGGWSSGGQNASSEVKRVQTEEPVAEYKNAREAAAHDGHQEGRRERKPAASFRGPNQGFGGNMEEEAPPFEQQHTSSGFRKYGGQNNRSGGQDNRRQNNNANINRERQRQNLHYEYQPVGSNNNNSNRSGNVDAPADGSGNGNAALRYKERGSGQSRRGGGNFYGRQ